MNVLIWVNFSRYPSTKGVDFIIPPFIDVSRENNVIRVATLNILGFRRLEHPGHRVG